MTEVPVHCLSELHWVDLSAQEGDLRSLFLSGLNFVSHSMNVRLVFPEDERCGILAALEVRIQSTTAALSTCIESLEANSGLLGALTAFSVGQASYGAFGSVLAEELLIRQRCVVELVVIVLGAVEKLSVRRVHLVVVLRELDIEVGNPTKLAVDVALL